MQVTKETLSVVWFLVCGDCNRSCIFGDCPDHGPLEWIDDRQVTQGTRSTCRDSLPSNLCLGQMGVFARERIEKRAMFGPFRGQKIPLKEMNFEGSANIMNMWEVRVNYSMFDHSFFNNLCNRMVHYIPNGTMWKYVWKGVISSADSKCRTTAVHTNCYTIGFHRQAQELELHTK